MLQPEGMVGETSGVDRQLRLVAEDAPILMPFLPDRQRFFNFSNGLSMTCPKAHRMRKGSMQLRRRCRWILDSDRE